MPDVTLYPFNTIPLTANVAYRLVTQTGGNWFLYILNLGPGALFVRQDADPGANDPLSMTVPSGVNVPEFYLAQGTTGLRVLANQDGFISVKIQAR